MTPTSLLLLAAAGCVALTSAALAVDGSSAYPSFRDFDGKAFNVSYDKRAITLDGSHVLFLSGAVHPPRGTPDDWDTWLAAANENGLNMVQVCLLVGTGNRSVVRRC